MLKTLSSFITENTIRLH